MKQAELAALQGEAPLVPMQVDGHVVAEIVAVEYLGADTLVETRIAGEPFIVRRPGRVHGAPGERIGLILPAGAAHWFDLKSEARIAGG